MELDTTKHYPVLLNEIISIITPQHGGTFIDCTFGQGGYTKKILEFSKKFVKIFWKAWTNAKPPAWNIFQFELSLSNKAAAQVWTFLALICLNMPNCTKALIGLKVLTQIKYLSALRFLTKIKVGRKFFQTGDMKFSNYFFLNDKSKDKIIRY